MRHSMRLNWYSWKAKTLGYWNKVILFLCAFVWRLQVQSQVYIVDWLIIHITRTRNIKVRPKPEWSIERDETERKKKFVWNRLKRVRSDNQKRRINKIAFMRSPKQQQQQQPLMQLYIRRLKCGGQRQGRFCVCVCFFFWRKTERKKSAHNSV